MPNCALDSGVPPATAAPPATPSLARQPLRRSLGASVEQPPQQAERRRARRGDDQQRLVRRRRHRHHGHLGLERDRPPVADVEVTRRPYDLVGNAAQLRPDLHPQIVALVVDVQAAEDVAVPVEQQRRLPVVDQQVGEEPLRVARRTPARPSGATKPPERRTVSSADVTSRAAPARRGLPEISFRVGEPPVLEAHVPQPLHRAEMIRVEPKHRFPPVERAGEIAAVDGDPRHQIVRFDVPRDAARVRAARS